MKHLLLSCGLLLLAHASHATTQPADTVQGQARFVRQMSATLCTRLAAESQKANLDTLSGEATQKLFARLMFGALSDNAEGFQALIAKVGQAKAQALGQAVGQEAVLQMVETCPASRPLFAKLSATAAHKQVDITAAERNVLLPVAQAICHRLDEDNAKQPFEKMAPAARAGLMEQAMQTVLLANTEQLSGYYGEDAVQDQQQMEQIGNKIGFLALEQCPHYLLLLGRDAIQQRQTAATPKPAAKPAAKAAPARRAPAKRTTK